MIISTKLEHILDNAEAGIAPDKDDCIYMLNFNPASTEAGLIRLYADRLNRRRFGNEGIILGQIGIETDKCPGKCLFCSFGEDHSDFSSHYMPADDIVHSAEAFNASSGVFAIFLLGMHNYNLSKFIDSIARIRSHLPDCPNLVVNIGDMDYHTAKELKNAGADGAYHVCRLREGIDTALTPQSRIESIKAIKNAGLDWYNCCEPIGPEHTAEELADQIFIGIEYGCFQHATMRRINVPGSPLAAKGEISEVRHAQITAVVSLASIASTETRSIAVHEPNLLGLTSGANAVYAESGANPRDTTLNTETNRGRDTETCKKLLLDSGFGKLLLSGHRHRSLQESYN